MPKMSDLAIHRYVGWPARLLPESDSEPKNEKVEKLCKASAAGSSCFRRLCIVRPSAPEPSAHQTLIVKNGVITQDNSDCVIKGNIQVGTGQRIYRCTGPGLLRRDYGFQPAKRRTLTFCSEAEARAAGWRKAKL